MKILNHEQILDLFQRAQASKVKIDALVCFDMASSTSSLMSESPEIAQDIIIRANDSWEYIHDKIKPMWNDLTEAVGLYPYVQTEMLSASAQIRLEYHRSRHIDGYILHEEQLLVAQALDRGQSVVLSAPTSFGKSLLIEEIIAGRKYHNIVIIQPTLALIDETRKKLYKYSDSYKIITSTTQEPQTNGRNIFLFTGERTVEYKNFPAIDFFIIDEFYKLSLDRDDERAILLNQAFGKLLRHTNRFYLLGPMIKSIPVNLERQLNLLWHPSKYTTVAVNEIDIEIFATKPDLREIEKREKLFAYLDNCNEQTIIYCSAPQKATELALTYTRHCAERQADKKKSIQTEQIRQINEWIAANISSKWQLIDAHNLGISVHHGGMPRHFGCAIVDLFNTFQIQKLFCTSTLIEGVNTTAKNIILFDKKKGKKPIDFFDYKNIAGRSGRMKRYFVGNVIKFEDKPDQEDLDIEIPIYDQSKAPVEILISLNDDQLDDAGRLKVSKFEEYPQELQSVLKENSGVDISKQIKIIKAIEDDLKRYHPLLFWHQFAGSFDKFCAPIELAWEFLRGPGDQTFIPNIGRLSARWLGTFAFDYMKIKSLNGIISKYSNDKFWIEKIPDQQNRINCAAYIIMHIARHWFDYRLPKWLIVISNLQKYVFQKHHLQFGDYKYVAASIENGFAPPNISAMIEYDIPQTALSKLINRLDASLKPEVNLAIIQRLTDVQLQSLGLIGYEISKIRANKM